MTQIPPITLTRAGKGITFCRTRKREGRMTASAPDLRRSNRLRWRRYANSDRTRLWIGRTSGPLQRMLTILGGLSANRYPETLVLYRTRPPDSRINVQLTTGRVRYICLKEAADEEAFMQIQWCCRDEEELGND